MKRMKKLAALCVAAVMAIAPLASAIPAQAASVDDRRVPDEYMAVAEVLNSKGEPSGMYGMDRVKIYTSGDGTSEVVMHQSRENRDVIYLQDPTTGEYTVRYEDEKEEYKGEYLNTYRFRIRVYDVTQPLKCKFTSIEREIAGEALSNEMTINFSPDPNGWEQYSLSSLYETPEYSYSILMVYKNEGEPTRVALNLFYDDTVIDTIQTPDGNAIDYNIGYEGSKCYYNFRVWDKENGIDYMSEPGSLQISIHDTLYDLDIDFDSVIFREVKEEEVDPTPDPGQKKLSEIFKDCQDNTWYSPYVMAAYRTGLMTGKSEGVFAPTEKLSRAQFAQILWRMGGSQIEAPTINFPDNKKGAWYYDAVNWATNHGIITGYTSGANAGKFCPANEITREQIAAMLYRFANNYHQIDTSARADLSKYQDAKRISAFAKDALSWANATGLITGKNETTLAPQGLASRCECATIIVRYIDTFMGKG